MSETPVFSVYPRGRSQRRSPRTHVQGNPTACQAPVWPGSPGRARGAQAVGIEPLNETLRAQISLLRRKGSTLFGGAAALTRCTTPLGGAFPGIPICPFKSQYVVAELFPYPSPCRCFRNHSSHLPPKIHSGELGTPRVPMCISHRSLGAGHRTCLLAPLPDRSNRCGCKGS